MKTVALLGLGVFLTVSCAKTEQESQVSNVTVTPCVQTKAGNEHLDRVGVEFTEKGVQITHYGFEVTCDFTTVNVTHSFLNGVQVYCHNDKIDELFSFKRVGGWIILNEKIEIDINFTHFPILI